MLNALSLDNPPTVWEQWQEPEGEHVTYSLAPMDYSLALWVLAAAWTTKKPTQLAGVVMFADSVAVQIITQRRSIFTPSHGEIAA